MGWIKYGIQFYYKMSKFYLGTLVLERESYMIGKGERKETSFLEPFGIGCVGRSDCRQLSFSWCIKRLSTVGWGETNILAFSIPFCLPTDDLTCLSCDSQISSQRLSIFQFLTSMKLTFKYKYSCFQYVQLMPVFNLEF